jgi:hypothetical protein
MMITVTERQPVDVACLRHTGPCGELPGRFWRGIGRGGRRDARTGVFSCELRIPLVCKDSPPPPIHMEEHR